MTSSTIDLINSIQLEIGRFIAPVIILVIKSCFFSGADSYSLGRKPHTSHFFLPCRGEMIRVICTILTVAIKDLKVYLGNLNLPLGKNAILFEPQAQKEETDKQIAGAQYYKYQQSVLQGHMLVLGKPGPKTLFCIKIELLPSSKNKLSSKRLRGGRETLRLQQFSIDIKILQMTLLIAQIRSHRWDQLMRGHVMHPGLLAVQQVLRKSITRIKMSRSQTGHHSQHLRLEILSCINVVTLRPLVPKVREHDMGRVRSGEKAVREIK